MCAFDKNRNLNYQRLKEAGSDIKKGSRDDTKSRFNSLKQNAGFYDKVAETLAKIQTSQAMLAGTQLKFKYRIRWIHELLGTEGIAKGPSGIRQALSNDEYKFDLTDTRNALADIKAQKEAVSGLDVKKLSSGSSSTTKKTSDTEDSSSGIKKAGSSSGKSSSSATTAKKLNDDQKKAVESLLSEYKTTKTELNAKKKRYKLDPEALKKVLKEILLGNDPKKEQKQKIKDLDKQIKQKEDDIDDSEKAENEYKSVIYILEDIVVKDAEDFLKVFEQKFEADSKKFKQKLDKMWQTVGAYKEARSAKAYKNMSRGLKKKHVLAGPVAPILAVRKAKKDDRRALKKATEAILSDPDLSGEISDSKTKSFSKSLDALVSAADAAQRLFLTLSTKKINGYKRMSEQLIDAFIDLHRNVERRTNLEVIQENCKKVILLIRRENRTYFFKEVIEENKKVSKSLEEVALVKTDEVGSSTTRGRSQTV